ncbi:hypothetical protein PHYPO_G00199090 [Pangasianodon hypophthalmus]|uniref:Agouti domain-containing protein n=1 Tax=Pangasianodon hypophthalmus TaxID=310915 RepID=A0A5N5PL86_PANHP|nr:agouti-signaling protein 2b [Pangasianodon hypophthalmus]KAB5579797.1 hypothetical protein PHYPO_G00199090 [Pangasianodon hypophthalmus]
MRMAGRYFLCISFFFALIQSTVASGDLRKNHFSPVAHHNSTPETPGTMSEEKPIGIFSRRRSLSPQRQHVPKPRPETGSASPGSVRQCARLMETCSAHSPCCNPCAICHCRLFNTICQCWRIGVCSRKN